MGLVLIFPVDINSWQYILCVSLSTVAATLFINVPNNVCLKMFIHVLESYLYLNYFRIEIYHCVAKNILNTLVKLLESLVKKYRFLMCPIRKMCARNVPHETTSHTKVEFLVYLDIYYIPLLNYLIVLGTLSQQAQKPSFVPRLSPRQWFGYKIGFLSLTS